MDYEIPKLENINNHRLACGPVGSGATEAVECNQGGDS